MSKLGVHLIRVKPGHKCIVDTFYFFSSYHGFLTLLCYAILCHLSLLRSFIKIKLSKLHMFGASLQEAVK